MERRDTKSVCVLGCSVLRSSVYFTFSNMEVKWCSYHFFKNHAQRGTLSFANAGSYTRSDATPQKKRQSYTHSNWINTPLKLFSLNVSLAQSRVFFFPPYPRAIFYQTAMCLSFFYNSVERFPFKCFVAMAIMLKKHPDGFGS